MYPTVIKNNTLQKRIICILFSIVFLNFLHAQKMHLYGDSLQKLWPVFPKLVLNQGANSFITVKPSDGTLKSISTIVKVDTSGKTIWTAYPTNYVAEGIEAGDLTFEQIMADRDSNLYTRLGYTKIAKIRGDNGMVDWIVPLQPLIGTVASMTDYDGESILFLSSKSIDGVVRLQRYKKLNGQNLGYIDLSCPSTGLLGLHTTSNGNIYLVSKDSCYKYTGYNNPVPEWKAKICSNTDKFKSIQRIYEEGNNLIVFGNKEEGFHNGMISCLELQTGYLKWFSKNGGPYDFSLGDFKIKNGFLYTSWKHLYIGSITERCFINKINMTTGEKMWEFNHSFRTQYVILNKAEAMVSLNIDDNEILYLAGYGLPDNETVSRWTFMKIRGSDGTILKKGFIPNSYTDFDYPSGISAKLIGSKLYSTGIMNGYMGAFSSIDTATLTETKTQLYVPTIQYTSSIIGIQNLSTNKKIILKKIGKSLKIEVADLYLNKIWEKTIGDTTYPYQGIDMLGVNSVSKTIFTPYRKYLWASSSNFYYTPTISDSFYLTVFDSIGNIGASYKQKDEPYQNPYQFFQDSVNRTWFGKRVGNEVYASPVPSLNYSIGGRNNPKPYNLIKPATFFPYSKDTILFFIEPQSGFSLKPALMKSSPPYHYGNTRFWYWPSLSIKWFNSVERETKDVFYVAAKDSSLNDLVFKYRLSDSTILWSKKFDSTIVTLKGYVLNGSYYALSRQKNITLVRKFDGTNGNILWTHSVYIPPGHTFKAEDFAISLQRQKITITGFLVDTLLKEFSKVHFLSLDTSGNVILSQIMEGNGGWQNKGLSVLIGQDGQTLISGQITNNVKGYSGFIYEVDSSSLTINIPKPLVKNILPNICSNSVEKKGKLQNPPQHPYVISIIMNNNLTLPFNWSDSSFSYPVTTIGNNSISVSYIYNTSSSIKDTSFFVTATPLPGNSPIINANQLSAVANGDSYQWFRNNVVITGEINKFLNISQSGDYSYTYTVNGCVSAISPPTNVILTSIVDRFNNNAIISIFPNPTSGFLSIKNLNSTHQYRIQIFDMFGKEIINFKAQPERGIVETHLSNINAGVYILRLWDSTNKTVLGNQQITIINK